MFPWRRWVSETGWARPWGAVQEAPPLLMGRMLCLQVVKLLLEGGSNPRDRNGGGVSALEMADDEEMKELLLTFTAAPAKGERQTGEPQAPLQVMEAKAWLNLYGYSWTTQLQPATACCASQISVRQSWGAVHVLSGSVSRSEIHFSCVHMQLWRSMHICLAFLSKETPQILVLLSQHSGADSPLGGRVPWAPPLWGPPAEHFIHFMPFIIYLCENENTPHHWNETDHVKGFCGIFQSTAS